MYCIHLGLIWAYYILWECERKFEHKVDNATVLFTESGDKRDFFLMYFRCPLAGTVLM